MDIFISALVTLVIYYALYKYSSNDTSKIFILGMLFNAGFTMAIQDWQGKEAYLKWVAEGWVDYHWLFGAAMAITAFVMYTKWCAKEIK